MTWLRDTAMLVVFFIVIGALAWSVDRFFRRNDRFNGSDRDRNGR